MMNTVDYVEPEIQTAQMSAFYPERGYGFAVKLLPTNELRTYFVHLHDVVKGMPAVGLTIKFVPKLQKKGWAAAEVEVIGGASAGVDALMGGAA
jgi:hypothetical protein